MKNLLILFFTLSYCSSFAQQNTLSSGGEATGSVGSLSYSIGQVDYVNTSGTSGSLHQGVQQPFLICNLLITPTVINAPCYNEFGQISIGSVTGGTAPFTYSVSNLSAAFTTTATYTNVLAGNYTVTVRDSNNCIFSTNITVTQPAQITFDNPFSTTICSGSSTLLNPNCVSNCTGLTYNWAPSSGLSSTNIQNVTAYPATTTLYTLTATNSNGCTATSIYTVVVNPLPTISVNSSTVCSGSNTNLTTATTGVISYNWSPSIGLSSTNTSNVTATPLSTTVYTVTGTSYGGCTSIATSTVTVNAIPTISATTPASLCGTGIVVLGAGTAAGTINWYSLLTGGTSLATGTSYTTPSISATTTYYVDASVNGCTTDTRTAVVATVNANPTANAGSSLSAICHSGTSAAMAGSVGGNTTGGTWSGGAGTWTNANDPANATYTASSTETDTITLTLTTIGGSCGTVSVTKTVRVISATKIISQNTNSQSVCLDGNLSPLSITASGDNLTYQWYSIEYPTGSVFCNGPTDIVDVTNPVTGKTWMDRNLGASRAAQGSTDNLAYGDLYQWGRGNDGHQCRNSSTTSTLSSIDKPNNSSFILDPNAPNDWRNPQNDNLWQGINGVNNPCPSGYRLPSDIEWQNEITSWGAQANSIGAINSPLKLPKAGYREYIDGSLGSVGTYGHYWSSTVINSSSQISYFYDNGSSVFGYFRAYGFSVRCIKESTSGNIINGATGSIYTPNSSIVNSTYYYVIVSGTCGADTSSNSGAIIVNPKPSVSLLPSNVLCNGTSTGSITNTNTGGTSFTYNWHDSNFNTISTNQNLDNVAAGTYNVQVTNNFGCSATATETITEPPLLNVTHNGITTICSGSVLNISINSEGGLPPYATVWKATDNTNVNGESMFIVLGAGEIINDTLYNTTTVAQNVSYTYSVTDTNQCEYHTTFDVTVLPLLTINVNASETQVCSGSQVTLTGSGNASNFSWNNGITNGVAFTPTLTQYYQVTGTDSNNCVGVDSVLIVVNPNPTVSLLPSNVLCNGTSTGSINNSNSGGTSLTYNWQDSNFNTISTTQNLENVPAGTYTVQVINNFGCSATATETISEPPFLNLTVSSVNNPQCAGDSSGTISIIASGGTAPYQFSLNGGVYSSSATFTGLTSGNYTITAKDVNNCMINTSVTLVDSSIINPIFPSTFPICSGSSFNLPTTSSNSITGTWNPPINNQVTTTYTFTPNAGQCSNTATSIVIVNQFQILASASVTDCGNNEGFIRVDSVIGAVGPFTYQLNNGTPQFNNPNFSGLQAGNYIIYATDANACVASANMNISSVQPLSINLSGNNLTCGPFTNASLNASVNGGSPPYQYNWLTTGNTDSIFNITSSGTYTLVVYDLYSCSVTRTLTVIEPIPLTANITTQTNISCNGLDNGSATVNASGGNSPYTYSWNTNPIQTGSVAINLFAGNYQVEIRDTNNCLATINVDITQPAAFTATTSFVNNITCNGPSTGSAAVIGTGGVAPYYYSWSTFPAQTTDTAFNLSAGNYTISVYDSNNCTATITVTISQSLAPNAIAISTNINCAGNENGTASVTVNGGTAPFTYEWNTTPAQTTPSVTNLVAGNYMIIVRDSLNCRDTAFVTIAEPQAIVTSITKTDITCFGNTNGSIIISTTGGIAPYTYLLNATQVTDSIFGLAAGNYSVAVTDANSCIITNSITITEPQLLNISIVGQTNVVGVGVNNGTATASVNGGTTPYIFNWSHNPSANSNFVNDLPAGTHIVTVIDNNNCSDTVTVIIITEQNYLLSENIITKTNVPFTLNIFTNDVGLSNFTTDTLPSSNAVNGTVRILQNGEVTYAPYLNFSGFDRVIVKACSPLQQVCLYDTIYITVKPNAQIDFSTTNGFANAVVATGNVLANDAGSGIQQSAQLISTVSNGTVTLDANGNFLYKPTRNYCGLDSFKYQICDTNNLCAIASCIFEVICRDITVFTGFSPNGDGINDNWVIADIEGTINTVSIFDRWGRLVNSYKNYDNVTIVWDGTNSSGNQLISGTYFYAIEIENKPRRLGWIEITR